MWCRGDSQEASREFIKFIEGEKHVQEEESRERSERTSIKSVKSSSAISYS